MVYTCLMKTVFIKLSEILENNPFKGFLENDCKENTSEVNTLLPMLDLEKNLFSMHIAYTFSGLRWSIIWCDP